MGTSGSPTSVGRIARVTPTETPTLFDVPGDGAWDIITGPDGNLWYTVPEGNDSKIGRITPAGEFGTQFDVTDAGDQLGITVGPDGALWFAQAFANSIGRMTLDGQFTVITGLTAPARPEYIAPGPDNTLWFTEKEGNRIGRITGIDVPQQQPPPPPPPPPDTTKPSVTRFGVTKRVFRLGGRGTVIKFTLSEDCQGHDQVRPSRARPLAQGAPEDDLPVHGRGAQAPLPRPLRPEAPAEARPLPDDTHGEGRGGQRLIA